MTTDGLPPLTWLRAFEASARHLSFTRAAAELNLTQSAVSQHVRSLEAFLGRELFVRRTRAIDLTEAGANYLPVLREAFDLLASGTRAFTGGDRGRHLILQCNMAFSVIWLAPRLSRLLRQHPWLVLNIVTPIWDPERHSANAAMEIRFGRPEDMSAAAERLTQERFFPVCAPTFQEGRPDPDEAVLMDCAGLTGTWGAWFTSQGKPFDREGSVMLTSTFVIAIEAAKHGAGMAMAHDTLAGDMLADGRLVRPFDHCPDLTEAYFLLPPADHAATPASRAFEGWLRAELAAFQAGG
ncbi:LysR family transcriptional regulator [Mameliella alba]|nr:LysR family transcriptional regulator [Mameliella alba]MBY6171886.1 LysR family transcriptional regulator [Mameliella alba]MBY6176014.1 LysR family transcriptional regulator [Mameliella alba]